MVATKIVALVWASRDRYEPPALSPDADEMFRGACIARKMIDSGNPLWKEMDHRAISRSTANVIGFLKSRNLSTDPRDY